MINIKHLPRSALKKESAKVKLFKALGVQFMIKHLEFNLTMGSDSFLISDTILIKASAVIL